MDTQRPRWAPVGPIAMTFCALAVSAVGAVLLRRPDDIGRILGPLTYVLGVIGLLSIMFQATVDRAENFAKSGVPTAWTRPPVRGASDDDLRRWDNVIRAMREPWPNERDAILTAARARAEGLPAILVPGLLAPLLALVGVVLIGRAPGSPPSLLVFPHILIGFLTGVVAVRYAIDGRRARAYLARFGQR